MKQFSKNLSLFTVAALALVDLLGAVPPATANPTPFVPVALETTAYHAQSDVDDMSFLATRSQRKPLTRAGTGPFTITHTNANAQLSYAFQTDAKYGETSGNSGHSGCTVSTDPLQSRSCLAQLRESDIRPGSNSRTSTRTTTSATLEISGNIPGTPIGGSSGNTKDGTVTFGTVFGPQIWSATFSAIAGSALSYRWSAAGSSDDYELYGFLVRVADLGNCTGNPGMGGTTQAEKELSHSILTYSRGKNTGGTLVASSTIQNDGCYRMRFVNGSYDASGGLVIGSSMVISELLLGSPQTITVDAIPDLVKDASQRTVQISASSNAVSATLTYTALNSSRCTVSSTGLVTVIAGAEGRCTFRLDSAEINEFVAANSTFVSFEILTNAGAPVYSGGAQISGAASVCSTLTVTEGTWGTGGSAITSTTYQWFRDGTAISGATTNNLVLTATDIGSVVYFSVTKTNSLGSTTAFSNQLVIVDARLTNLGTSGSTITFDPCTAAYAITSATNQFTVTATANLTVTSLVIGGSGALSGQATAPITLNPGPNTITVVATSGQVSRTTTLTVTWGAPPTVNILGVLYPSASTATLQASINANGFAAETISFAVTPLSSQAAPTQGALSDSSVSGTIPLTFTQALSGLTAGSYQLVVTAENIYGVSTAQIQFSANNAPQVLTGVSSNEAPTSVSLSYTINSFNVATDGTLLYSTNPSLALADSLAQVFSVPAAASSTSGVLDVSGLLPGTRYFYRFSAENTNGSNVGAIQSFVTSGKPVVDVSPGIGGETTMTMLGVVNAAGLTTTGIRFYYSSDPMFATSTSVTATPATLAGNADNTVSARVTGLAAGTYFYMVEATNDDGTTLSVNSASAVVTDNDPSVELSAPSTVTKGSPIALTVRFSEPVTGFATNDLVLSGLSAPGYVAISSLEIAPGVFAVTLTTTGTQTGTLTIALPANVAIDASSKQNTAATSITVLIAEAVVVNNPGSNNLNLPEISYPEPSVKLVIGSYATLTPESTGGAVVSWAIDLTLPEGLAFDAGSGVISGIPTTPGGAITFTITGTNADGSANTQLQIEVLASIRSDGPLIEFINPRIVFVGDLVTITVGGKRLQLLESVTIDGVTITVTVVSRTLASFETPALKAGKKNLIFQTDGHGELIAFNALEVVAKPAVPATESPVVTPTESPVVTPTESPVVTPPASQSPETGGGDDAQPGQRVIKRTVSGFAPGSSELTAELKALIAEKYAEVGSPSQVTCIGFTQGPTTLAMDIQLSLDRATVACDYLKTLNPSIEVLRTQGKQADEVGSAVRRVELYFIVPITR